MQLETQHVGRPLKFASVADLETKIAAYFKEMDREEDTRVFAHGTTCETSYEIFEKDVVVTKKEFVCGRCGLSPRSRGCVLVSGELKLKRPYTVTGLALWLDTTRQTLLEYQGEVEGRERDPKFADTIVMAKARIENYASERLFDKETPTRGVIFSLSNNAKGWTEKTEVTSKGIDDLIKEQEASSTNADPRS